LLSANVEFCSAFGNVGCPVWGPAVDVWAFRRDPCPIA